MSDARISGAQGGQPVTLAFAQALARKRLAQAGLESAALDARLLLCHVIGLTREQLMLEDRRTLTNEEGKALDALLARREVFEPIAYLIGEKEFFGHRFQVTRDTLVPRPDTEILVETALAFCRAQEGPVRILDLGTGSGAILLSLLAACPDATGIGVDFSEGALGVARINAAALGLAERAQFVRGNWATGLDHTFDVVVTNPPYIRAADMAGLMRDVVDFEPASALEGGADGLDPLRAIAGDLHRLLRVGGLFCAEIGQGQEIAAQAILEDEALEFIHCVPDLNDIPRCMVAKSP